MAKNFLENFRDFLLPKPTVLGNILGKKETVPNAFIPPAGQPSAVRTIFGLPNDIPHVVPKAQPVKVSKIPPPPKVNTGLSRSMPKIGTPQPINLPLNQPGLSTYKPAQRVLGVKAPTPTPTPDPRASWTNFKDMVIREGNKRGYNGEILARQKANESDWGNSNFAKDRYNYGGIGAYTNDPEKAFRYASPEDYLMGNGTKGEPGYFNLIEKDSRYKDAYKNRADVKKYLAELQKAGYASDPNYIWKVMNTRLEKNVPE